jgi:hypothetical protein
VHLLTYNLGDCSSVDGHLGYVESFAVTKHATMKSSVQLEAEIGRIEVRNQPGEIVCKNLSEKYPTHNQGWWNGSSGRTPAKQV